MIKLLEQITLSILMILPLLIVIAFFTLAERKILAAVQRRVGPNVTGIWGLLQPIADGLKLLLKEIIIPARANFNLFLFAPILTMVTSFTLFTFIPFSYQTTYLESNFSLLLLFTCSSFGVYGIIIAGWSSNSKYALLGSIRSIAQMLSYELILSTILLIILISTGSLRLIDIVAIQEQACWLIFPLLPVGVIFFITLLAETNRIPFDLAEAESELVAGYNVEYSSITFSLFFLGEYCSIAAMSVLCVLVFFGGWVVPFNLPFCHVFSAGSILAFKSMFFCFLFIFVRAVVPRYRFDQLMFMGWNIFLPLVFSFFIFVLGFLLLTNSFVYSTSHFLLLPSSL